MDPNETLRLILKARRRAEFAPTAADQLAALKLYAEHSDRLFTWLSNGGFQPAWGSIAAEVLS